MKTKPGDLMPVLILMLLPALAQADADLSRSIDTVFADIGADEPGCAVGVVRQGNFVHKAGYGLANLEYDIPVTSKSVFRVGSVSKQFTAMAIALLAERGSLDLDSDVHTYLPDLKEFDHKVTLRQMVHHYAGMGDYDHDVFRKADGSEFRFGNEDFLTINEFYQLVSKADLALEPGTRWQYSNLGYFLLSQVVERVSGKTLREFAQEEIFGPLGMNSTLFNDNVNQIIANRAAGYQKSADGHWEAYDTNLSWVGDGGLYTTIEDFIRWDSNFYDNQLGNSGGSLIEMMETPLPGMLVETEGGTKPAHYAFGLSVDEQFGERVIGHGGSWVAFTALYTRLPEHKTFIVVFCNSLERSAYELGDQVVELSIESLLR